MAKAGQDDANGDDLSQKLYSTPKGRGAWTTNLKEEQGIEEMRFPANFYAFWLH